jgi:hypothetical protein
MTYVTSTMKESAHGWRLTYFDGKGEPVASFWATTRQAARAMASQHVKEAA